MNSRPLTLHWFTNVKNRKNRENCKTDVRCERSLLTDHDSRRHRVPLQPEGDEGARDQDYPGNEDSREVEGPVPREYEVDLQAAIIT